jgi:hypothetical protein
MSRRSTMQGWRFSENISGSAACPALVQPTTHQDWGRLHLLSEETGFGKIYSFKLKYFSRERSGGSRELPSVRPVNPGSRIESVRSSKNRPALNSGSWVVLGSRLLDQPIGLPPYKAAPLPTRGGPPICHFSRMECHHTVPGASRPFKIQIV